MDLCSEIVKEMTKLEFSQRAVDVVKNDVRFIQAIPEPTPVQKTLITMTFYGILMKSTLSSPPLQVRLALNAGTTSESWLDDIKLVILPWLKINEERYFPVFH